MKSRCSLFQELFDRCVNITSLRKWNLCNFLTPEKVIEVSAPHKRCKVNVINHEENPKEGFLAFISLNMKLIGKMKRNRINLLLILNNKGSIHFLIIIIAKFKNPLNSLFLNDIILNVLILSYFSHLSRYIWLLRKKWFFIKLFYF